MAFVFIPLVFLGLYNLFNTEKKHYYLIIGATGLILSHNIMTVLTAIFAFIYCIVNFKNIFRTKVKKGLIIDIVFILIITSFYWMPLLQTKFYTNYRVFEEDAMTTEESFLGHALTLKDLLVTSNDTVYVFEIGLPVIFMMIFSIMVIKQIKENKKEYIFFLISGIISVWMTTKYFPWKFLPNSFYIIQFPWRMLLFSTFFFAIICSINMTVLIKNFNIKDILVITVICILYLYSRYGVIQYSENVINVEEYQTNLVTGQNNEWLPGMGRLEYLPSKAYNNTFYIAIRDAGILSIEGDAEIQDEIKFGTHMTAKISTGDNDVILELPYIYYPGYTVRFDGIVLDVFETDNGFLGCNIENNENGELEIEYTGTAIMNISKVISIFGFIVYLVYVWKKH